MNSTSPSGSETRDVIAALFDPAQRPVVMGILNATPDSFSDGGKLGDVDAAVQAGLRMAAEGAEILDVGGESTRPGAARVDAEEQVRRTAGVITTLRLALDEHDAGALKHVQISIDTTRAAVAEAALDAGATILNDVAAGREDAGMFELAAERGVPLVLMHMQGEPGTMQDAPAYADVCAEVQAFLLERAKAAISAGVRREQIVLDPGIGFGKTLEHNLDLLRGLPSLVAAGYPVLLGASRKRMIAALSPLTAEDPAQRVGGTCATTVAGVAAGVRAVRVHDVLANRQALDVAWGIARQGS